MEIGNSQNSVSKLQAAISAAKSRTDVAKTAYQPAEKVAPQKRVPKGYSTAGSLFERLYGKATTEKVESKPVMGTKFDVYG
jgi:hypothetical protein